jgi:hypothetical protein
MMRRIKWKLYSRMIRMMKMTVTTIMTWKSLTFLSKHQALIIERTIRSSRAIRSITREQTPLLGLCSLIRKVPLTRYIVQISNRRKMIKVQIKNTLSLIKGKIIALRSSVL